MRASPNKQITVHGMYEAKLKQCQQPEAMYKQEQPTGMKSDTKSSGTNKYKK